MKKNPIAHVAAGAVILAVSLGATATYTSQQKAEAYHQWKVKQAAYLKKVEAEKKAQAQAEAKAKAQAEAAALAAKQAQVKRAVR